MTTIEEITATLKVIWATTKLISATQDVITATVKVILTNTKVILVWSLTNGCQLLRKLYKPLQSDLVHWISDHWYFKSHLSHQKDDPGQKQIDITH